VAPNGDFDFLTAAAHPGFEAQSRRCRRLLLPPRGPPAATITPNVSTDSGTGELTAKPQTIARGQGVLEMKMNDRSFRSQGAGFVKGRRPHSSAPLCASTPLLYLAPP